MAHNAGTAFITISPSFRGFQTKAEAEAKKLRAVEIPGTLNLDDGKAREKITAISRPRTVNLGVNVDTGAARSKLDILGRNRRTTINANADTGAARAEIDSAARNRRSTINVHADTGAARAEIASLSGGSVLLNVALALSPLAGPLAAVLGGGALGLGGIAAGVGAGVAGGAAIGIASIKSSLDLQKKLTQASKARVTALAGVRSAEASLASAVRSSNNVQIAGTRAIVSAQQSLADARRNAATVAINSARQIASAEQALVGTERQLKDSLDALHAARLQAKQDLLDLKDATQHDALNTEGAQIALVQAQQNLVQVQSTALPGSLALREAELQYKEAVLGVSDAKRQQTTDTKALNKATKDGINGSQVVKSAQEQVQVARQAVAQARTQLQQAKADAARAKADAARGVARAETALAQAKVDAARNLADAHAREAVARDRVAAAQTKLNKADAASAALMARMTPMQAKLIAGIKTLRREWQTFLDSAIAGPVDNAALAGFGAIRKALPGAANFIKPVARASGSVFKSVGNALSTPGAKGFASDFGQFSGSLLKDAGRGTINIGHAFANILRAFMPLSREMSKGLVGLTRNFAKWSDGLGKSKGFQSFIGYVRKEGPIVLDVLGKMGVVFGKLLVALAPLGALLISGLKVALDWLAKLTPGQLVAIAAGVTAIGVGLLLVATGTAPIGLVVAAVVALAGALVYAYKNSETFRKIVNTAWAGIKIGAQKMWQVIQPIFKLWVQYLTHVLFPVIKFLWERIVKPYYTLVFKLIAWAWKNVIQPAFQGWAWFLTKVLFPVVRQLWNNIVKPYFKFVAAYVKFVWENILQPAFKAWWFYMKNFIFPVIRFLWNNIVKPLFTYIGGHIRDVWNNVIHPVFDDFVRGLGVLKQAFRDAVDAIGRIWDGLKSAVSGPVRFVVETVYNHGILKVVNAIPGVPDLKPIKLSFADGGVLPGYTPGRDVHQFYSPTGGQLSLSGGEAIMRPEFTRAVGGASGVDRLNKAARMGGFASGGVWRPINGPVTNGLHDQYTGYPALDFAGPVGRPVASVAPGRVSRSYDIRGYEPRKVGPQDGYRSYGRVIYIDHGGYSTLYAHLNDRDVGAGATVRGGQVIGHSGNTGNTTGPHLHFGSHNRSPYDFLGGSTGYSGSASGSVSGAGAGGSFFDIGSVLKFLHVDQWKSSLGKMGDWGHMLGQMVGNVVPQLTGWVKDKVSHLVGAVGSTAATGLGLNGGTVQQVVQGLASRSGWGSGAEWSALASIIASESGWNPKAQNPTSTAYGLFQFLDSTWASVGGHKTSDAGLQTQYGLRYIANRYHDPIGAWNFHKSHGWYDDGGYIPPGVSTVFNGTGKPEPVLTSAQWADIRKAGMAGGQPGTDRAAVHMEHVHVTNVDELIRKQKAAQRNAMTMSRLTVGS